MSRKGASLTVEIVDATTIRSRAIRKARSMLRHNAHAAPAIASAALFVATVLAAARCSWHAYSSPLGVIERDRVSGFEVGKARPRPFVSADSAAADRLQTKHIAGFIAGGFPSSPRRLAGSRPCGTESVLNMGEPDPGHRQSS
jgi:hypothetical protein